MAQIKAERDVWGSGGDSNDRYRTIKLVVTLEPENPERAEQAGQAVAWRLVECGGNWGAVCDLAAALLARDTLTYGQACPIIEKALRRSHRRRRCFQCRELQRHQEPPR